MLLICRFYRLMRIRLRIFLHGIVKRTELGGGRALTSKFRIAVQSAGRAETDSTRIYSRYIVGSDKIA